MLQLVHGVDVSVQVLGQEVSISEPVTENLDVVGPVVGRRGDRDVGGGELGLCWESWRRPSR